MKSVLLIGLGRFGRGVAEKLNELHHQVLAIDRNEERVNDILPLVTDAQIGDATSETFLRTLGVDNFDVCIVTIGEDFQSSLETTSLLKELGAKKVVSRATNDVQMKFLLRNGADEVVYPEKQMAMRIATKYASESILDFIQLDNNYSIYEMKVPKEWYGKTLVQIDIRRKFQINVLTIKRSTSVFIPGADTVFQPDDIAFVIGEVRDIQKCFKI